MILTPEIYFGGPDQKAGLLRDILEARVAASPPGSHIDWVTYYFRDLGLAKALVQAHKRGVHVTLVLEGRPRIPYANNDVIAYLSGPDGLGDQLRVVTIPGLPSPSTKSWKPQLHEKLYCFSYPEPVAFIGSFNPSGNVPEIRSDIIREIGDQDRGHNVLVGLKDQAMIEPLIEHARSLHALPPNLLYRLSSNASQDIQGLNTYIYFWPRVGAHPIMRFLRQVGNDARIRIAASHIRAERTVDMLINLAKQGARLEILAEATYRRVTLSVERRMLAAGIQFKRIRYVDNVPMHLKFVLVEKGDLFWSVFGSFNWTKPSFWLNHEIAVISRHASIFRAFENTWDVLKRQADKTE